MIRRHPRSIRTSLLINLLAVLLLLSGGILLITTHATRTAIESLSRSLISRTIDQTVSEMDRYVEPIISDLKLCATWGKEGLLDTRDHASFIRIVKPLISNFPQISAVMLADLSGNEQMLLQKQDQWRSKETRAIEWADEVREERWSDSTDVVSAWKRSKYDPRLRPWFKGAIAAFKNRKESSRKSGSADVYWTEPYALNKTKPIGITVALAYTNVRNETNIVAFDILLREISWFTMNLDITPNGQVIILSHNLRLIGLPRPPKGKSGSIYREYLLKTPAQMGYPDMEKMLQPLMSGSGHQGSIIRSIRENSSLLWIGAKAYPISPDYQTYVVVFIPQEDILGELAQLRLYLVVIIGVVLLLAVLIALRLSGRYSKPIEALVKQSQRISKGDLSSGTPVVSSIREFKRLTEAHEDMRQGLEALLKLERDIQLARQIQQDTFPDRLPRLNSYQLAAYCEPAEGAGGDSYDVIGFNTSGKDGTPVMTDQQADRVFFLLADATGHGIGPAISVTQVRSALRMALMMGQDLPVIIENLNTQLNADLKEGRFVTAWVGHLDTVRNELTGFSAGQAPLILYRAKENSCRFYIADAPPFGTMDEMNIEMPAPIQFEPGDLFVVLSDGLIEPMDADGNLFGKKRVAEVLRRYASLTPDGVLSALLQAIDQFSDKGPADDDRTALIIKRIV